MLGGSPRSMSGFQQRIVGAAEHEGVGVQALGRGFGAEFFEVNTYDLLGHGMIGPAFFDEGDKKRAGFLESAKAMGLAGGGVGVALNGGIGGDDENVAGLRRPVCGLGTGLDDAEDGDRDGFFDVVEREGAGGVAGDDEVVGALFLNQETRALGGIAGDGAAGLGAIGKARGIADESVVCLGGESYEGAQDGEAAEAGIEDADGGWGELRLGHGLFPSVGVASAVR